MTRDYPTLDALITLSEGRAARTPTKRGRSSRAVAPFVTQADVGYVVIDLAHVIPQVDARWRSRRSTSNPWRSTRRVTLYRPRAPALRYSERMRRGPFLVLFAVSGAAALIYEVVWTRLLTLHMGHGLAAASAVLAAFMGGLAAGAAAGGRDRPALSPPRPARSTPASRWRSPPSRC